jgi:hypothetical protein
MTTAPIATMLQPMEETQRGGKAPSFVSSPRIVSRRTLWRAATTLKCLGYSVSGIALICTFAGEGCGP